MKIKKLNSKKKSSLLLGLILFTQQAIFAQQAIFVANTNTGGTLVTDITAWGDTIKTVLDAAVAVFAIVGGFIIFIQYMQGNEQAQKNFIKFVIGLAVFALVDGIVTVFIP